LLDKKIKKTKLMDHELWLMSVISAIQEVEMGIKVPGQPRQKA
jgi:hypothetical protein